MKILVAVNSQGWDGNNLIQYLQMKEYETIEAKSLFVLFEMLGKEEFDLAIVSQDLIGLKEEENYISKIRDIVPIKSNKRIIFHITSNTEKLRDELINEHFFDFLTDKFKPEELLDLVENPRTFDDVRHFQIRTVKKTIEKDKVKEIVVKEEVLSTKVLPNKVVGFHGATSTTTLMNTAVGLSKDEDLKIILVDMNPNAHLTLHFTYDKYLNVRCMSELIECIRKDQLNKDTINRFLIQHSKYKNIYLLPGFKNVSEKNFFDFPEAEEGKYLSKIMYCLRRNSNLVLVDTPRQFFFGGTIDTISEADTMYFITMPYLPSRIDIKTITTFFVDKEHNNDFRLIVSSVAGSEVVSSKDIFNELKDIKQYSDAGKETGEINIFKSYLEVTKINNMSEITEDRKYAYEIHELEAYRDSINKIAKDIYYYSGEESYGKKLKRNQKGNTPGKRFSLANIFSRSK